MHQAISWSALKMSVWSRRIPSWTMRNWSSVRPYNRWRRSYRRLGTDISVQGPAGKRV